MALRRLLGLLIFGRLLAAQSPGTCIVVALPPGTDGVRRVACIDPPGAIGIKPIPCVAPVTGTTVYVDLGNGLCLPLKVVAAPGFSADFIRYWTMPRNMTNERWVTAWFLVSRAP